MSTPTPVLPGDFRDRHESFAPRNRPKKECQAYTKCDQNRCPKRPWVLAATVQAKLSHDLPCVYGVCAVANQSESDCDFNGAVNACAHASNN